MAYEQQIQANRDNPEQLEAIYQAAQREHAGEGFAADLRACYTAEPENRLYAAWFFRLQGAVVEKKKEGPNWKVAVPLAAGNGLALWALSLPNLSTTTGMPYLLWLAAPVTALFVLAFLALTSGKHARRALLLGGGLGVVSIISLGVVQWVVHFSQSEFQFLLVLHLALLGWAAIGAYLTGLRSNAGSRFAFLVKSIECFVTGGVYLIAGVAFGGITVGMFAALSITLPNALMNLIILGGAGLIPVMAVATIYDPLAEPQAQDFKLGLSRFVATLMRLLLPLTLGVLAIYVVVIPFNFLEPFKNRDVLIVYNVMLFAILGLLVGVTPLSLDEVSPRLQGLLRRGIQIVMGLAVLVSLYALAALVYRTAGGGLTINRLTTIGWNVINIMLLGQLFLRQVSKGETLWNERIQGLFNLGAYAYVGWSLLVVLGMGLIFG